MSDKQPAIERVKALVDVLALALGKTGAVSLLCNSWSVDPVYTETGNIDIDATLQKLADSFTPAQEDNQS